MKSITIYQPFASFIIAGEKQYETRAWKTDYRGPLAIHAGKMQFDPKQEEYRFFESLLEVSKLWPQRLNELPRGCVIGIVTLVDCHKIDRVFVEQLSERERITGDFSIGRYAWELSVIKVLREPIPARGEVGLWTWRAPWEQKEKTVIG